MDILRGTGILMFAIFVLSFTAYVCPAHAQPPIDTPASEDGAVEPVQVVPTAESEETFAPGATFWEDATAGREEDLPSVGVWNILITLALVLVIFWVIFRFVVRPLMRSAVLGRGVEEFRIVAALAIAPTKSVQIVKLVDRLLVIGIAESGMNLLSEITDPELVSEMLNALDAKNPAKHHPFRKAFDTILSRKDETGFEEKQKKFNTTLDDLKLKIKAMKTSPDDEK
jgi:flagellar biogenesis protein FliO